MRYQKVQKQHGERDKLRQFRELDDAFAQALRQLEDPENELDIPTGPPVRSLEDLEAEEGAALAEQRDKLFHDRLKALISDYELSDKELHALIQTLLSFGLWQADRVPAAVD